MSVNKPATIKAKDLKVVVAKEVINDPVPVAPVKETKINPERLPIPALVGFGNLPPAIPDLLGDVVTKALTAAKVKLGTLTINGTPAEPVKTGIKLTRNFNINDGGDSEESFYIPWGVMDAGSGKLFNLYPVTKSNGVKDYYLVCEDSEVVLSAIGGSPYPRNPSVNTNNLLVLVNSKSDDDMIVGTNSLVNVSTSYCTFNNSDVKSSKDDKASGLNTPWGGKGNPFLNLTNQPRRTYESIQLKKCNIVNSGVTKGRYIRVCAYDSEVAGSGYATVTDVDLNKSTVRGANVKLASANLYDSIIQAERDVTVQNGHYRNETFRDKQIFIQNRFDYLTITSINGEVALTRSSQDDFDLGLGYYNSKTFSLAVTRQEIEDHVKTLFNPHPAQFGYTPTATDDPITASIIGYTVDAVCSRLKVINMLRAIKNLSGFLHEPYDKYEDMYEL